MAGIKLQEMILQSMAPLAKSPDLISRMYLAGTTISMPSWLRGTVFLQYACVNSTNLDLLSAV
jgi:hypothetical protein